MKLSHLVIVSLWVSLSALFGRAPNVVVILTDDQGWGDLSLHGNTNLETPHLDSLALEGAQFERFYVCPVCSPTRAEFLTGRYHLRSGVTSTSAGGERMNVDEATIAEAFRDAGYATGAFGKWHNGMQYPYHPNGRGFDEFYGFCSGHWGHYFDPPLDHNGRQVQGKGFVIDDFTEKAMAFMEEHQERPFFVYLPYNTPHSPMQVPDQWWNRFKDRELVMRHRLPDKEDVPHTRAALAMCENIDWNVGRVLAKIDALALREDTIVVYFCDNGPNGNRWNGGMKGRKGSTDEGGVRSPLFIRWPRKIASQVIGEPASAIDLLPTLTALAGVAWEPPKPLDGLSLRAHLLGEPLTKWVTDRPIYSAWRQKVAVRQWPWIYTHDDQLFHLDKDPGQQMPIGDRFPDKVAMLARLRDKWVANVAGMTASGMRPFVIGHPDCLITTLPARDATAHGGIKRSNRFPNDSHFTHWTSLEDEITWPVEVQQAGKYAVELHYTCPEESTGSEVVLSLGNSRLVGTIREAHDPPLLGAEEDRVPRIESYVKAFKAVRLGELDLEEGQGTLSLRATRIPGEEVMDFRLLQFTRLD